MTLSVHPFKYVHLTNIFPFYRVKQIKIYEKVNVCHILTEEWIFIKREEDEEEKNLHTLPLIQMQTRDNEKVL